MRIYMQMIVLYTCVSCVLHCR